MPPSSAGGRAARGLGHHGLGRARVEGPGQGRERLRGPAASEGRRVAEQAGEAEQDRDDPEAARGGGRLRGSRPPLQGRELRSVAIGRRGDAPRPDQRPAPRSRLRDVPGLRRVQPRRLRSPARPPLRPDHRPDQRRRRRPPPPRLRLEPLLRHPLRRRARRPAARAGQVRGLRRRERQGPLSGPAGGSGRGRSQRRRRSPRADGAAPGAAGRRLRPLRALPRLRPRRLGGLLDRRLRSPLRPRLPARRTAPRRLDLGRRGRPAGLPGPGHLRGGPVRRDRPRDPDHVRGDPQRLHRPRHPLRLRLLRSRPAADGPAAAACGTATTCRGSAATPG